MVRRVYDKKKKRRSLDNRGASYVNIDDVNRNKKTGEVSINKGATSYNRSGDSDFRKTNQNISGTVNQKTNNTKELSEKFRQKTEQENKDRVFLDPKKEETRKVIVQPFEDPKGFIKDTFSPETLKETIPLALGASGAQAIGAGFSWMGAKMGSVLSRGAGAATQTSIKLTNGKTIKAIGNSGGASTIVSNTKNVNLAKEWLTKLLMKDGKFNPKSILKIVTGLAAYTTATAIGQQQMSERGESIQYLMKDLRWEAKESGDWETVHEAEAILESLLNLSLTEQVGKWTPLSLLIGADKKTEAATKSLILQKQLNKDLEIQQETGETENDTFVRNQQEIQEMKMATTDYYNEQRREMLEWEREAEIQARNEDAAFWKKKNEESALKEKEDMEAIAKYWEAYRKEKAKQYENSRPSNLNFGLV